MNLFRMAGLLTFAGVLTIAPVWAQQSTPAPAPQGQGAPGTTSPQAAGMMDHAKMMADMKAADARLQQLLQVMQAARGDDRLPAIQELLSQLVQDQIAMHARMGMMHEHMMMMPMPGSRGQAPATPPTPATPAGPAHQH